MSEVKANLEEIDTLVDAIKTRIEAIDPSVSSVEKPSKSKGIMVSEYHKRIKEISSLLEKYLQLLDKDVADINTSKETIIEMDKQMAELSNSI